MNNVTADLMLQLIGPTMLGLIVLVCFGAWLLLGRRPHLLIFASAPLLAAVAAVLQIVPVFPVLGVNVVLSNLFVIAAYLAAAEGVLARSGKRIGLIWDAAILVGLLALMVYFYFVAPNFHARVYLQSSLASAILLGAAARLRHLLRGHIGERLLFGTMLVYGVALFPLAVVSTLHSSPLTASGFSDPAYWQMLQLTNTVLGAAFIVSFIVAVLIDFIDDLRVERDLDTLTGVFNRRGFEERTAAAMKRPATYPLTLIVCDLDHFKRVNDTYGHSTGDEVLTLFGGVLKSIARDQDLVGRLGGEEFAIVLPDGGLAEAGRFVTELQRKIREASFPLPDAAEPIAASLGVAERLGEESYQAWFQRADGALYRAKVEGRNRAVFVGEIPRGAAAIALATVRTF
ncbi:diguanylate cyclase [Amorphus sp. MBR-141]